MPVNLLLCEGQAGSPDVRLLRTITRGIAAVRIQPQGAKYGLGQFIRAYREAAPQTVVAGIRDSDFDRIHPLPAGQIRNWRVEGERHWLGWFWERTEIENYLLDPAVVHRVFPPDTIDPVWYRSVLDAAITELLDYTAARAALSRSRGRFDPLPNIWGNAAGIRDHRLPLPCSEEDCRMEIERIVVAYGARIQVLEVLSLYEQMLNEYRNNHRQEALLYFSGKDIICAMREPLQTVGFSTPGAFREKVLTTIEASPEEVWTWLPEWSALRMAILNVGSNQGPM